ncbi:MAG: hypothetical protein GY853_04985 [PVC group bacterium]|nr:hypothetical protein [PVC group bacterium]
MKMSKSFGLKFKVGIGIVILFLTVGSFLAANNLNDLEVEDSSEEGKISVEFKDAAVQDVFRVLALKGNVNIVSDPDVKGLITVHISDVHWEKVLDVICRTYGYAYEREGNIIRVTTLDKQGLETLVTEVFALSYSNAEDVVVAVEEMKSERGKVKHDARSNLIIVTDIPTNIYKIGKVIARLDTMTPQVTIEAKIIETALNEDEQLGMKWNPTASASLSKRPMTFPWEREKSYGEFGRYMPVGENVTDFPTQSIPAFNYATTGDFSFGVLDATTFSLLLEAIKTRGKTRILSNPRITTLDNHPAEIHVGTDWPIANYSYNEESDRFVISGWEYKSYGVLLQVTPTINQNGYVTLKLHPEISDMTDVIDFQGAKVPILSTQTTDATVMVKDGETLVIGGLLKDKTVTTKSKVPILSDIPILGLLFTHKSDIVEKRDLLIFITPHIIDRKIKERRERITAALAEAAPVLPPEPKEAPVEDKAIEDIVKEEEKEFFKEEAQSLPDLETLKKEMNELDAEDKPVKTYEVERNIEDDIKKASSAKPKRRKRSSSKPGKDLLPVPENNKQNNKGYIFRKDAEEKK